MKLRVLENCNKQSVKLKFKDFKVPYLIDETLREGVERCPFPISSEE